MDWTEIKKEYITSDTSYRKLAKKYKINPTTVMQRGSQEGWVEEREQFRSKSLAKSLNAITNAQASRIARTQSVTDELLGKIEKTIELIDAESLDTGAYRQIAATLKDILTIQMSRPEADMREQEARIDKLRRDADKGDDGEDKPCGVVLMPPVMDSLTPPEEGGNG